MAVCRSPDLQPRRKPSGSGRDVPSCVVTCPYPAKTSQISYRVRLISFIKKYCGFPLLSQNSSNMQPRLPVRRHGRMGAADVLEHRQGLRLTELPPVGSSVHMAVHNNPIAKKTQHENARNNGQQHDNAQNFTHEQPHGKRIIITVPSGRMVRSRRWCRFFSHPPWFPPLAGCRCCCRP